MRKFILICLACAFVWLDLAASFKIVRNKRSSDEIPRRCYEPPDSGPCRAGFENYFYNATSDECETFIYGGCQGNDNNFWSKHVCEGVCLEYIAIYDDADDYDKWQVSNPLTEGKDDCEYPPDEGLCRALIPQYYFNGNSCELFAYGGCGGNPNRFNTEEECTARCGPKHYESDNEI